MDECRNVSFLSNSDNISGLSWQTSVDAPGFFYVKHPKRRKTEAVILKNVVNSEVVLTAALQNDATAFS